jgi:hypothetical protein
LLTPIYKIDGSAASRGQRFAFSDEAKIVLASGAFVLAYLQSGRGNPPGGQASIFARKDRSVGAAETGVESSI